MRITESFESVKILNASTLLKLMRQENISKPNPVIKNIKNTYANCYPNFQLRFTISTESPVSSQFLRSAQEG
ncbi:hypothetical protein L596_016639 [Steinernema carpocapsae]|uniref:Uncharacterized protein n=1 Tax=Steinernema carpocapsae TaxID=34508 RepID=A0A4U5NJE7_STECR|nr:hypothetical protein L596_016639 [Steinernema carpocapsae]